NLTGVDVAEEALKIAKRDNPAVNYVRYDGLRLPFNDAAFDCVLAICVTHHVPPAQWPAFYKELARVLKPGGLLCVFEHNPWNPATRMVVNRCEFDRDAVLLTHGRVGKLCKSAGLRVLDKKFILCFPWRGTGFRRVERILAPLPFGAQYYVTAERL